jgi:hypothetical protein
MVSPSRDDERFRWTQSFPRTRRRPDAHQEHSREARRLQEERPARRWTSRESPAKTNGELGAEALEPWNSRTERNLIPPPLWDDNLRAGLKHAAELPAGINVNHAARSNHEEDDEQDEEKRARP